MTVWAFLMLAWLGALGLLAMVIAAAIILAVGQRRIADALRLDLGDDPSPAQPFDPDQWSEAELRETYGR